VFHNKFEQFTENIKTNTYLHKKDLEMMTSFVESMQLQTFWEWAGSNEQMWHVLWSRTPFED
jgi:hypothetical protein